MESHKIFPKLKKKLRSFLTDEGGSITRKDILSIGAATMLIAGSLPGQTHALTLADCHSNYGHTSAHSSGGEDNSHASSGPMNSTPAPACTHESFNYGVPGGHVNQAAINTLGPGSDSKIVNGHYNQIPPTGAAHVNRGGVNINPILIIAHSDQYVWHASHASHSDS